MDFKTQATLLNQLLIENYSLWCDEVMNDYPHSINQYPPEWLEQLAKLSTEELFAIDSKQSFEALGNSELKVFLEKIRMLSYIPPLEKITEIPLEDWAYSGVKYKKRHEIQKIIPSIKKVFEQTPFDHINDIGGGVGHLARILAHYHSIPSFSIDQNMEFQKTGKKRVAKFRKIENAADVIFINAKFGEDRHAEKFFTNNSFSIGLHTCGSLAVKLIEKNIEHKTIGLLSFGCCYLKMNADGDFPISNYYQKNKFQRLNLYGLSLATRSHAETNFQNYQTRQKVKNYRYGLHLFLMKHFNRADLLDVGECLLQVYEQPISHYILLKLSELKIEHSYGKEYIENFFYSKPIQHELSIMFLCNIIRWQLGRALEVFILLDRSLFLEENGYEVKLEQYFIEALSPRNIGILALKK